MNFLNYKIDIKKKDKRDKLLVLIYHKTISLLALSLKEFMEEIHFCDVFPHKSFILNIIEDKNVYVLNTNKFKQKKEEEISHMMKELEYYILSFNSEIQLDLKEWFHNILDDTNIKNGVNEYLSKIENRLLDNDSLDYSGELLAMSIMPFENYIKNGFLTKDGQKVVGSNFDINNITNRAISTLPQLQQTFYDQTENNVWFIPIVLFVIFIIVGFMILLLYFTFRAKV